MKAVTFQALHAPLALETVPDPEPGKGELVVKVGRCGICGSDLHMTEDATYAASTGTFSVTSLPERWSRSARIRRARRSATSLVRDTISLGDTPDVFETLKRRTEQCKVMIAP
jgi:threonine dehydrogenase-like Zn-dependent dehydrogenase